MQLMRSHKAAYTIMELIMVVVILGLMAVFAVPNYTKAVRRSYERTAMNNLSILYGAQLLQLNSGNGYKNGNNITQLNTQLKLGIVDTSFNYTCGCDTGVAVCTVASTNVSCNAVNVANGYNLLVTSMSTTPSRVCCQAGACPTAGAAVGAPPACP